MPRLPKTILWWSSDIQGRDLVNAVPTNKEVWLHGEEIRQLTPFQIRRRNLLTRIPRLGQRRFGSWVADVPTEWIGSGVMRSRFLWRAAVDSQIPSSTHYFFTDNNGATSGLLTVSNTPTHRFRMVRRGGAALNPDLEVGLSSIGHVKAKLGYAGKEYEFTIEGEVIAPRDPDVEIEVLEPFTSEDLLLDVASEVLYSELETLAKDSELNVGRLRSNDTSHAKYHMAAMSHIQSFLGRRYVDFVIDGENRFVVSPDKPQPVSVTIRGDGPVKLLFAIRVRDRDTGAWSISEFMPVVVSERQF